MIARFRQSSRGADQQEKRTKKRRFLGNSSDHNKLPNGSNRGNLSGDDFNVHSEDENHFHANFGGSSHHSSRHSDIDRSSRHSDLEKNSSHHSAPVRRRRESSVADISRDIYNDQQNGSLFNKNKRSDPPGDVTAVSVMVAPSIAHVRRRKGKFAQMQGDDDDKNEGKKRKARRIVKTKNKAKANTKTKPAKATSSLPIIPHTPQTARKQNVLPLSPALRSPRIGVSGTAVGVHNRRFNSSFNSIANKSNASSNNSKNNSSDDALSFNDSANDLQSCAGMTFMDDMTMVPELASATTATTSTTRTSYGSNNRNSWRDSTDRPDFVSDTEDDNDDLHDPSTSESEDLDSDSFNNNDMDGEDEDDDEDEEEDEKQTRDSKSGSRSSQHRSNSAADRHDSNASNPENESGHRSDASSDDDNDHDMDNTSQSSLSTVAADAYFKVIVRKSADRIIQPQDQKDLPRNPLHMDAMVEGGYWDRAIVGLATVSSHSESNNNNNNNNTSHHASVHASVHSSHSKEMSVHSVVDNEQKQEEATEFAEDTADDDPALDTTHDSDSSHSFAVEEHKAWSDDSDDDESVIYAGMMATRRQRLQAQHDIIKDLLRKVAPEELGNARHILRQFVGREECLINILQSWIDRKYPAPKAFQGIVRCKRLPKSTFRFAPEPHVRLKRLVYDETNPPKFPGHPSYGTKGVRAVAHLNTLRPKIVKRQVSSESEGGSDSDTHYTIEDDFSARADEEEDEIYDDEEIVDEDLSIYDDEEDYIEGDEDGVEYGEDDIDYEDDLVGQDHPDDMLDEEVDKDMAETDGTKAVPEVKKVTKKDKGSKKSKKKDKKKDKSKQDDRSKSSSRKSRRKGKKKEKSDKKRKGSDSQSKKSRKDKEKNKKDKKKQKSDKGSKSSRGSPEIEDKVMEQSAHSDSEKEEIANHNNSSNNFIDEESVEFDTHTMDEPIPVRPPQPSILKNKDDEIPISPNSLLYNGNNDDDDDDDKSDEASVELKGKLSTARNSVSSQSSESIPLPDPPLAPAPDPDGGTLAVPEPYTDSEDEDAKPKAVKRWPSVKTTPPLVSNVFESSNADTRSAQDRKNLKKVRVDGELAQKLYAARMATAKPSAATLVSDNIEIPDDSIRNCTPAVEDVVSEPVPVENPTPPPTEEEPVTAVPEAEAQRNDDIVRATRPKKSMRKVRLDNELAQKLYAARQYANEGVIVTTVAPPKNPLPPKPVVPKETVAKPEPPPESPVKQEEKKKVPIPVPIPAPVIASSPKKPVQRRGLDDELAKKLAARQASSESTAIVTEDKDKVARAVQPQKSMKKVRLDGELAQKLYAARQKAKNKE